MESHRAGTGPDLPPSRRQTPERLYDRRRHHPPPRRAVLGPGDHLCGGGEDRERPLQTLRAEQSEWLLPGNTAPETKGWIGERFDADAGLQYLNARYYDPELSLFLQPDWFEVTKPGVGTNRFSKQEGDMIKGAANRTSVGTLVERKTRFVTLAKMDGNGTEAALEGFTRRMKRLPAA